MVNFVRLESNDIVRRLLSVTGTLCGGAELANNLIEFGTSFSVLGESEADAVGSALSKFGSVAARIAASTNIHVR